jgi:hypothetical protein
MKKLNSKPSAAAGPSHNSRKVNITELGVRLHVQGRPLTFWSDELIPWRHRQVQVRWNSEKPEFILCLPPADAPFVLKARKLGLRTATAAEQAAILTARKRWDKGKART